MLRKRPAPRVALTDALIIGGLAIMLGVGVYFVFGHSHSAPASHLAVQHTRPAPNTTTPQITPQPVNQSLPPVQTIAGGLQELKGIQYGTDPSQTMDAFLPAHATQPTPAVIFVHGGGFTSGGDASLYPEAKGVATVGWAGLSVDYRLTGYPDESNDVIAAVTWLHDHARELNVNPNQIVLLGTSAGGTLVAQAATVARQENLNLGIKAVVSWSGPMDLPLFDQTATQGAFHAINSYVGCSMTSCPSEWTAASPYTHVTSGDPPMYLFNSTCEAIPYNQATSMVQRLQSYGDSARLYTLPGKLHAMNYASVAYAPTIQWLTQFLGPVHGALPSVPSSNPNLAHPNSC